MNQVFEIDFHRGRLLLNWCLSKKYQSKHENEKWFSFCHDFMVEWKMFKFVVYHRLPRLLAGGGGFCNWNGLFGTPNWDVEHEGDKEVLPGCRGGWSNGCCCGAPNAKPPPASRDGAAGVICGSWVPVLGMAAVFTPPPNMPPVEPRREPNKTGDNKNTSICK